MFDGRQRDIGQFEEAAGTTGALNNGEVSCTCVRPERKMKQAGMKERSHANGPGREAAWVKENSSWSGRHEGEKMGKTQGYSC